MAREKDKKIGVLYFKNADTLSPDNELARFVEEINNAGYEAEVLYYYLFAVFYQQDRLEIYYDNKKFDGKKYKFLLSRYDLTRNKIYDSFSIGLCPFNNLCGK